jgi:L-Ala-D/L-Glu epimerase
MIIEKVRVLSRKIPLRMKVRHAQAEYGHSENIYIAVSDARNIGYGEVVPRYFMPGYQTALSDLERLDLEGTEINSMADAVKFCRSIPVKGCARCAAELAVLDLAGKSFGKPVSSIFKTSPHAAIYTAVIPTDSMARTRLLLYLARSYGFRHVKLKVGMQNDLDRIRLAKAIMPSCDLRVDANMAWDTDTAVERIREMRPYVNAVEQPVKTACEMAEVRKKVDVPITADESLCTLSDARELIRKKACDIFDIRLSKCGGLLNAWEIFKLARKNRIQCMLGCQVGETAILSAAGRQFAQSLELRYVEGSYDRWLLKENTADDVLIGKGGLGSAVLRPGLGISNPNL